MSFVRVEVIDIHDLAAVQHLHETIARHCSHCTGFAEGNKMVAIHLHHSPKRRQILIGRDRRAYLEHDVAGGLYLIVANRCSDCKGFVTASYLLSIYREQLHRNRCDDTKSEPLAERPKGELSKLSVCSAFFLRSSGLRESLCPLDTD
jgi:hypothetical protein